MSNAAPNHYVDNKEFYSELVAYLKDCDTAEAEGKPLPIITDSIAIKIKKIAEGLGSKYRFARYTYLQDMINEGILACIRKIRNFDYNKYDNPFSYFTQICWYEFISVTNNERDESRAIYHLCEQISADDLSVETDDTETTSQIVDFLRQKLDARELISIHEESTAGKFVHRMKTSSAELANRQRKANAKKGIIKPEEEVIVDGDVLETQQTGKPSSAVVAFPV